MYVLGCLNGLFVSCSTSANVETFQTSAFVFFTYNETRLTVLFLTSFTSDK